MLAAPAPAPDTAPNDGTRIMFVGDSITGSPGCWRPDVWVALTDAAHDINMVGIRTENGCGEVLNAAGESWDPDNIGIGGITTTRMWVKLAEDEVLPATDPDVIVMLLGTNDLFGGATADHIIGEYDKLLELYREYDPAMSVVVGTPPPMTAETCGCEAEQQELAAALPAWAEGASTPDSPVTIADLSTGFDAAADTYDGVHPNDAGNAKLAAAWTPVISAALDAKAIAASASPSATASASPSASGDPSPEATETGGAAGEEATPPSAKSWLVFGIVVLVAVAVTLAMTRRRSGEP